MILFFAVKEESSCDLWQLWRIPHWDGRAWELRTEEPQADARPSSAVRGCMNEWGCHLESFCYSLSLSLSQPPRRRMILLELLLGLVLVPFPVLFCWSFHHHQNGMFDRIIAGLFLRADWRVSSSLSAEMSRKVENFVDEGGVLRRVSLLERQTAIGFSGLPSSRLCTVQIQGISRA